MKKIFQCLCQDGWRPLAPLLIRIGLGLIFFVHGYQKITQFGVDGFAEFLTSLGIPLPELFAVIVIALELAGGVALIAGLFTHWTAKLFAFEMLVAIALVHLKNGFFAADGGYEFALLLLLASLSLVVSGPGKWSLDARLFHKTPPPQPLPS